MLVRLVGMRLRSALTARVCDKGMLAAGSIGTSGVEPSVLSEVDLVNIFRMVEVVNELWVMPLHTMLSLSALAYILGWQSVLAGLTAALLIVPLLILVVNIMAGRIALLMAAKDQRVSLVREVLAGVKHVKLYGWQAIFERKIDEMRALELKALGRVAFSNLSSNALSSLIPTIMVSVSFGAHIILTGSLTSSVIFPSLILFNGVSRWMEQLPRTAMTWKTGVVSYQRVQEFLTTNFHDQSLGPSSMHEAIDLAEFFMMGLAINVPEADGRAGPDKTLLRDVDFHAVLGNLTIITGPVGSGKTTLLRTIVGEIQPRGGMVQASGRLAYSSQRPFLINGSIRENILFGLPFDALWYQKVLDSVCLSPDLALLPDGDTTVLGGMGATLSGGQQSRVVLARAVYSRRPLVVLDDPLAAMDPSVQRQLVKNVLGTNGILKDCTRIVVTSNQALIQQASAIYAIENGTLEMLPASLTEAGYEEVAFKSTTTVVTELEHVGLDLPSYGTLKSSTIPLVKTRSIEEPERDIESTPLLKSTQSKDGRSSPTGGGVAFSTYLTYLSCAKLWGWPLVLGLAASCTLLEIRSVYYLQEVGEEFETTGHSAKLYFYILCRVIGSAFIGLFVLAGYFGCLIPTSRELHDKLTRGVLESQFGFFDTTPMGAIISRFTTDISRMDGPACSGFISLCSIGTSVLCSVLVVVSTSVSSVLYMAPLAMLYVYIQKFYLSAYRQLRRLDNKTRGPILNVANEMRVGYSVILAYQQAEFFSERARDLINEHLRVWAPFLCLDIWLQLRLYTLACVVQSLTATLLLAVGVPSSTLGLVMSFVLQITNLLGFLVQTSANLEADLTSLERISEYMGNTPEADNSDDLAPPPSWPSTPSVAVENFSAAYRRGGLLCLRDVNFCIPAGQRVAVVGRTGAGKSSLVLALMRAIDQAAVRPGSRILIDGVDIMTEVPLDKLRKKITVIPQEPVVFSGSIRDNLDPDGGRSEEELRNAVAASRLGEVLGLVPGDDPLDFKVTNAGSGLSTGQIQLLAITRAIVAKPALIIVDEATSAIDSKMATLITDVMRQAFKGITTITVAHQIWSVIDYDWILVLDRGSAIEFASPETLLKNPDSQFSRLVRDAGIETRLAENDPLEEDLS
ncbi:P-loop containing nucleoside triphosphate hydrolase protein [Thozetella sp. PMI_491]|nr:P-loop containing nucleoside triphosphate hydrolase protein [Thozetella sp. PMI_491]